MEAVLPRIHGNHSVTWEHQDLAQVKKYSLHLVKRADCSFVHIQIS